MKSGTSSSLLIRPVENVPNHPSRFAADIVADRQPGMEEPREIQRLMVNKRAAAERVADTQFAVLRLYYGEQVLPLIPYRHNTVGTPNKLHPVTIHQRISKQLAMHKPFSACSQIESRRYIPPPDVKGNQSREDLIFSSPPPSPHAPSVSLCLPYYTP